MGPQYGEVFWDQSEKTFLGLEVTTLSRVVDNGVGSASCRFLSFVFWGLAFYYVPILPTATSNVRHNWVLLHTLLMDRQTTSATEKLKQAGRQAHPLVQLVSLQRDTMGCYVELDVTYLCPVSKPTMTPVLWENTRIQCAVCPLCTVCQLIWKIRSYLCNPIDLYHSELCFYGWEGVKGWLWLSLVDVLRCFCWVDPQEHIGNQGGRRLRLWCQ